MERTITKGPITVTTGPVTETPGPVTTYPANAANQKPPLLHSENLYSALVLAIEVQEKTEKELGYFLDSCMLATWKQCRDALARGQLPVVKMVDEL